VTSLAVRMLRAIIFGMVYVMTDVMMIGHFIGDLGLLSCTEAVVAQLV
jgi:hypothetical protein